jgi:DNA-directed RNA polymerase specialized sigma subunit
VKCLRHKEHGREKSERRLTESELKQCLAHFKKTHDISAIKSVIRNELPGIKKLVVDSLESANSSIVYDDLIGAGLLGLISASHRFDPEKDSDFAAHAAAHISRSIQKELDRFNATGRPRNILGLFKSIKTNRCGNCPRRCFFL